MLVRYTKKKALWVILDGEGQVVSFTSAGRTSYMQKGFAEKVLTELETFDGVDISEFEIREVEF